MTTTATANVADASPQRPHVATSGRPLRGAAASVSRSSMTRGLLYSSRPMRGQSPGLALALAIAAAGSACKRAAVSQVDAGAAGGSLGPEGANQVLARVGERAITLGDYVAALEHMDEF